MFERISETLEMFRPLRDEDITMQPFVILHNLNTGRYTTVNDPAALLYGKPS